MLCADQASCTGEAREVTETVREIGARLEKAALELENDYRTAGYNMPGVVEKFEWTYYVVNSATPNAFCLPGGYVAVYTGILDITGNNDGRVSLATLRMSTSSPSSWATRSAMRSPTMAPRG